MADAAARVPTPQPTTGVDWSPPRSGWFAYGAAGQVGEWDGVAWTGRRRPDASVVAMGKPTRPARERTWVVLLIVGLLVTAAGGFVGLSPGLWWLAAVFPGLLLTGAAAIELFRPRLRFETLPRPALLVGAGILAGAVGFGLAFSIESFLWPALGFSFATDLWLAGVVEETCKLLVPVVLFVTVGGVFRDPRAGVLLALLSGTVFGVAEGILYIGPRTGDLRLLMALARPLAEAGHPLWTAIAATLIWFAARRAGRLVTTAGVVGWLIAAGSHSLHDGLGSGRSGHSTEGPTIVVSSVSQALTYAGVENLFSLVWLVVGYLVLRHVARELVPPDAVVGNPPRWRPRLMPWGVPKARRAAGVEASGAADAQTT